MSKVELTHMVEEEVEDHVVVEEEVKDSEASEETKEVVIKAEEEAVIVGIETETHFNREEREETETEDIMEVIRIEVEEVVIMHINKTRKEGQENGVVFVRKIRILLVNVEHQMKENQEFVNRNDCVLSVVEKVIRKEIVFGM